VHVEVTSELADPEAVGTLTEQVEDRHDPGSDLGCTHSEPSLSLP
jgi:hypothetical protein